MTEELPYRVLRTAPEYELRRYDDALLVTRRQGGEFAEAGTRAFGSLAGFISGRNSRAARIAMTAPVLQVPRGELTHDVSFVLPAGLIDAPEPIEPGVRLERLAGHDAAVRTFRGSWSESRARAEAERLRRAVAAAGLETTGEVAFARFDPPWKPGFLRRNEVMLALAAPLDAASAD